MLSLFLTFALASPSHVDLNRYAGVWYEAASIPQFFQRKCARNTRAEYVLEDGEVQVTNSCLNAAGERESASGRARVVDPTTNAQLEVTFVRLFGWWIYAFGGDYWIEDLYDEYSVSLVGSPSRKYAWILSRSQVIRLDVLKRAEAKYRELGYDTCAILTSVQDGSWTERKPLCEVVK